MHNYISVMSEMVQRIKDILDRLLIDMQPVYKDHVEFFMAALKIFVAGLGVYSDLIKSFREAAAGNILQLRRRINSDFSPGLNAGYGLAAAYAYLEIGLPADLINEFLDNLYSIK